jgi:hypothetical protein
MASFKLLLDHDVRHLASCFADKQTLQLEDVGLTPRASDEEIIAVASEGSYIIVTNNARDFERGVPAHIARTSKKRFGCRQVHGLVIVKPSMELKQVSAIERAIKQMQFEGRSIGWKAVHESCLKVVISDTGAPTITRLPRCPSCTFDGDE